MQAEDIRALSQTRYTRAKECLATAKQVIDFGDYKTAANRSYYAIFHAMRAILAYDGVDMKSHSGIISEFRRRYIKTEILSKELSPIISTLFDIRSASDYNDFFIISKAEVARQVENAEKFLMEIGSFLDHKE